jgi:hypothetical protein
MSKISLVNHLAAAPIPTATSQQTSWPAWFVQLPQERDLTWRSTTTATQTLIVDFGSAKLVQGIALLNTNYATAQLFLDDEASFATADYTSPSLTIYMNPWNDLNAHFHLLPSSLTRKYLKLLIPTQATTDGRSYFSTGGIWAGPVEDLPHDIRLDEVITTDRAESVQVAVGGQDYVLILGPKITQIDARRIADQPMPWIDGTGELALWRDLDRRMDEARFWLFWSNRTLTSEVWVMRRMNRPKWPASVGIQEDEFLLREVIAGG